MIQPNVTDLLAEQGIQLKNHSEGQHYAICPQCSDTRKGANKRKPCLSVKIDGGGSAAVYHCNHCDWAGQVWAGNSSWRPDTAKPTYKKPSPIAQSEFAAPIVDWFKGRGISEATLTKGKVKQAEKFFPQLSKKIKCVAFDYWKHGEVVARKYRSISAKEFCQDAGCEQTFYGWDDIDTESNDTLYIVEGEIDKLTLGECGIWNCLSVPSGAKKLDFLEDCEELLAGPTRIVLACDLDEVGQTMADELARRLGKERCFKVYWPKLEGETYCKDANDTLMQFGKDVVIEALDTAQGYPIQDVHTIGDFMEDVMRIYRGEIEQPLTTGYPNLDRHWKVKSGDITVVTGVPNTGKSEFMDALLINLATQHHWKIGCCSFENPPADHITKLIEKRAGAPFHGDVAGRKRVTEFEINTAAGWLSNRFYFVRSDDPDDRPPTIEWIIEKAIVQVRRYGIKAFVIDPYNEISSNRPSNMTETEYVSYLLSCVKRFAQTYGVHTFIVAHPTKMQSVDGVVLPPSLYDIAGSAHWANKADNGLTVHRQSGVKDALVEVYIRKVRWKNVGKRGGCALFKWQPWCGRLEDAGEMETAAQ